MQTAIDQINDRIYRISTSIYRRLADLGPRQLAIMHGSAYDGDCPAMLRAMADVYEQRFGCGSSLWGATGGRRGSRQDDDQRNEQRCDHCWRYP
jgi:hypothetical protein